MDKSFGIVLFFARNQKITTPDATTNHFFRAQIESRAKLDYEINDYGIRNFNAYDHAGVQNGRVAISSRFKRRRKNFCFICRTTTPEIAVCINYGHATGEERKMSFGEYHG